ncbi:MAG: ribonuclease HII [Geminicoccaceae bacterium]
MRYAGVDEVGRGPLAGPVVAAAVVLHRPLDGLDDSKRLRPAERQRLARALRAPGQAWIGLGAASVREIDRLNIRQATFLAMLRAIGALPELPARVLVDGNALPGGLPCPGEALIKGDSKDAAIAAASICAKVVRDAYMARQDVRLPGYGWASNAGYPTAAHVRALRALGVSVQHRQSFAPVRLALAEVGWRAGAILDAA